MSFLLPPLPPTFEAALRDVRAHGVEARRAAAERLGRAGSGAAPALRGGAASDEDERARALPGLLALVDDRDARVRAEALASLKLLADPAALPALRARADDADPRVSELAVVALGALRGPAVEQLLRGLCEHAHAEVRFAALQSYVEVSAEPEASTVLARLADEDREVRAIAARCSRAIGPRAHTPLLDALGDVAVEVRAEAALALCELGDARAVQGLTDALELPELQLEALDAIGAHRVLALREPVAVLAGSVLKPRWLKAAAARALVRLGDDLGVAALREVLRGLRRDGRSYAAEVAGELGLVALVPELVRLAERPRGADPMAVAGALTALLARDPRARPGLEHLARRSDEAGAAARAALGR